MEIKQLSSKDAKEYWELRIEALKENPESFVTVYDEALETKDPLEKYQEELSSELEITYGAFEEEKLIGSITLSLESARKMQHKGHILNMYVTPDYRKIGVGKELMDKIVEVAKSYKMEQLQLTVVSTIKAATTFYSKYGFETYGVEMKGLKLDDTYWDQNLMVLFL